MVLINGQAYLLAGLLAAALIFTIYVAWQARRERISFLSALAPYFAPPEFPDKIAARLAGTINTVLLGVALIVILMLGVTAYLRVPNKLWLGLGAVAGAIGLQVLLRRGQVRLVAALLPPALLVLVTVVVFDLRTVSTAVTSAYFVVIVTAGLLVGGRAVIAYALLSLLALLGALMIEVEGVPLLSLADDPGGMLRDWIVYLGVFGMMALLLYLATRGIREGLDQAQQLLTLERKRVRQMRLLANTAHLITGYGDSQALMDEVVRRLNADFGYEHAGILLAEGDHLVVRAVHSPYAERIPPGTQVPRDRGIIGWAVTHGQTCAVADAKLDSRYVGLPGASMQSEVAVPLRRGGNIIGVLNVESEQTNAFDAADIGTLESLADLLSASLQSSDLLSQLRKRERMAEALRRVGAAVTASLNLPTVLDTICAETLSAFDADGVAVWLLEDDGGMLRAAAAHGLYAERLLGRRYSLADPSFIGGRAVRERRPVFANDIQRNAHSAPNLKEITGAVAVLATPIVRDGQPLGALAILDADQPHRFNAEDIATVDMLGNQIAIAIQNARLHAQVQSLAATDALTGLSNRRAFDAVLATEISRAKRYTNPLSLVILDLDDFKHFNDTYGHPAGDERLKAIARLLNVHVRHPDLAARYGGEEFALILPHTAKAGAVALAERIRASAAAEAPPSYAPNGPAAGYTLSAGVATFPDDAPSLAALVRAADLAELAAKRAGKNQVQAANSAHKPPAPDQA